MSESNVNAGVTLASGEQINKAIAKLAVRVSNLEKGGSAAVHGGGDGKDLRPILAATLADLKTLRTVLVTGTSEVDERLKQLAAAKEENEKLRYQIKHLKRSLEAEEKKNAS